MSACGRSIGKRCATRGYTVLQATQAEEALDIVRDYRAPIHLLLADVVMPGMSGLDAVRARTLASR